MPPNLLSARGPTRRQVLLGAAGAALVGPARAADPARALASLAERYYEAQARFDPLYAATLFGDNRFDDRLPLTIAPAQRQARFSMLREAQRELALIPRAALAPGDALTHDLLARELATRLGFEPFPDHLMPLQQMDSVPVLLANFASGQGEQPLATPAQQRAYLKRVGSLPAWSAQAIANMREGMARGVVRPRPVVEAVLAQLRPLGSRRLEENPFWGPATRLPAAWPARERQRLQQAWRAVVERQVAPAMRQLAEFVEREYLPASASAPGWGALPDGAAWYRQWVRDQTTTELGPEEIHALGRQEVARIQAELARLGPALGYAGEPRGLLAWVHEQARFRPFRSEAQIIEAYREIDRRVREQLPRLFGRRPRAGLDIRPEPELTRATASDHYAVPAEDGSRPGIFWAVINDPASYESTGMAALFLHEGQPGHHFQMALQQEMRLPSFRRRGWINAYGEGWALYAETLGHEMGLYEDPAAYVGQLRLEVFRAARLVVDTGLHAQGWSVEQAVAYLVDEAGLWPPIAQSQVLRYLAWPAQALGYKIGSLKIQQLRERARQALGERFDIAAFHDAVLGDGPLPLALLEQRIEGWIAARRG